MAAVGTSSSISGPGSIVSGTGGGNSVSATADGENSGRWTQEEHERFLQGLDMYGKKWTKVAEVVSSRTTVQVRSHAQKYFQKMVKGGGRESMDVYSRPGMPGGGIPRPYRRQRLDNESIRKIPVPPPLQPFVTPGSGDIASGLYTYLSPSCVPTGTARSDSGEEGPTKVVTGRENDMTMAGGNGVVGPMNALMATSNDRHAPPAASSGIGMGTRVGNNDMNYIGDPTRTLPLSAQPTANMTTINVTGNVGVILDENGRQHHISNDVNKNTTEDLQNSVPEWYHKGKDIPNLLSAAENLDWLEDSGGPPGPPNTQQGGGGNAMPSVDGARSSALASNHNSQALYPQSTSSSDASLIAAAGQPISSGQLPPSHWYPMGHLMGASGPHPHAPYSSAPASSFSKGRGGGGAGGSSESNSAKTHVAKNFGHPSSSAISSGCSSVSSSSYSAATQLQTQHSSGGKKGWPQGHKASGGDSGRSNALSQRRPHGASFGEGDGSLALSASHNSGLDMASMDLDDSTFESIFNDEDDDMIFNQNNMP